MKIRIISAIIGMALISGPLWGHSKAIKPGHVDMFLQPYFKMQESLSKDDLSGAKKHSAMFKEMLGHGPSFDDAPSLSDLSDAAENISYASGLNEARNAFHVISKDMSKMVEHVGTSGKHGVFVMSCPMAFKGKGGEWLQHSKQTANPYFGASMYGCGSVKTALVENSSKMSEKAHNSHSHKKH